MLAGFLFLLFAMVLVGLGQRSLAGPERQKMLVLLLAGYVARPILFLTVMRNVAFFSHGVAGGDCVIYGRLGSIIARRWELGGVHFVLPSELPQLGSTALVCNTLALLEYVGGEPQPLAGTLVNAFLASWMVLIMYRFLRDWGVGADPAFLLAALTLFGPSYLYHTSDTYKDGLNAFLVLSSLLSSVRLARRFEVARVLQLAVALVALWFVRHYMVFMCLVPLALGILGAGQKNVRRQLLAAVFLAALGVGAYLTGSADALYLSAEATMDQATSENFHLYNATGRNGSGVLADSFFVRLIYTIFAPFPWQGGSFGLQLGKIESLIAYSYILVAIRWRKHLWATYKAETQMFLLFLIPGLIVYAMSMSNIGLIVRQRMPLMLVLGVIAALAYEPKLQGAPAPAGTPQSPRRRRPYSLTRPPAASPS